MSDAGRANLAQKLLDNPLFPEVVEELKAEMFSQWKDSSDAGEREEIFAAAAALESIHTRITLIMENYLIDNPKGSTP